MSRRTKLHIVIAAASVGSLIAAGVAFSAPAVEVVEPETVEEKPTSPSPAAGRAPISTNEPLTLSSLRLPKRVEGQRGRARILVGMRLSRPGTITVQLQSLKDQLVVRTVIGETPQPTGRNYVRIDATDDSGFQLKPGAYRLTVSATDSAGQLSNELQRNIRLVLTPPRGRFDAYVVPMLSAFKRKGRVGHIVAAVGPGSPAEEAGIQGGDIVTRIGTRWITSPGSLGTALRAVQGSRRITVRVKREGQLKILDMTPDPDWTQGPDYESVLDAAAQSAPNDFAIHYAQAAQLVDVGELDAAGTRVRSWRRSWRISAPGQYLLGRIFSARDEPKSALAAYLRAEKRDPTFSDAVFGQGSALNALGKPARARAAFTEAERLDPTSAAAAAFSAFVLLSEDKFDEALEAANRAVALDPLYADGHIPRGIALLKTGVKPEGLQALRRGLLDLSGAERVEKLITEDLEPSDP